jgi:hypothetical protein
MISRGHLSSIDTEYWICVNIHFLIFLLSVVVLK